MRSYRDYLIKNSKGVDDFFIVRYHSTVTKEVNIVDLGNYSEISFPSPLFYIKTHVNEMTYATRIVDILTGILKTNKITVISRRVDDYELAKSIKTKTDWQIVFAPQSLLLDELFPGNRKEVVEYLNANPDLQKLTHLARKEYELVHMSDEIQCFTNDHIEFITEHYQKDSSKVVDIKFDKSTELISKQVFQMSEVLKGIKSDENEKIILFAGRILNRSGIAELIEAFKKLVQKHSNIKLVLAGGGNTDKFLPLCKGIWNKIIFTGYLTKEDLCCLYKIADIGILPFQFGSFSFTALEMNALNLPLILTDTSGFKEYYENNPNCLIVKRSRDESGKMSVKSESLYSALEMLIEKKKLVLVKEKYPTTSSIN